MSIYSPKNSSGLYKYKISANEAAVLNLHIIRQYVRCIYIEKSVELPDNMFILN